ncbi:hypothetical protein [Actinotalea sp. Marseille-Q4924]|uniref:hypothetical protein n=1 Tax=Actinotalea sp. Marseille-Q4924 TaxID=2866571 RepID=UPI001CE3FD4B|nr:hypothetical protein [Actinotalea sp. Marseille-Q4924]
MSDERPDTPPRHAPRADASGASGAVPRRRGHRRATGGTAPPGTTAAPAPAGLGRSPDDTDEGWGDRPGGDDDERILREVPPHW